MDKSYTELHRVNFYNSDRNGNMQLSSYLNWCGEIAGAHIETRGVSRESMLEEQQVFLLSKIKVLFHKPVRYRDDVTLRTWEHSISGAKFFRCFALEKDGERLCESKSAWVLVDLASRRILRPTDYKHEFVFTDEIPITAELTKMKMGEFPLIAQHIVSFSETDGNGHLNNSEYGSFLTDYAPDEMAEKMRNGASFGSVEIAFIKEAKQNDRIDIYSAVLSENSYAMYGAFADGKRCFEAQVELMV